MKLLNSLCHVHPRYLILIGCLFGILATAGPIRMTPDIPIQRASLELPDTIIAQEILAQVEEENWYRQYDSLGVFSLENELRYCVWNKKTGTVDLSQCWTTHEQFKYTLQLKLLEKIEQLQFTAQLPSMAIRHKRRHQLQYVEKWAETAMKEMVLFGIPASISLAQGIIESDAGRSSLARNHRNHFGIKFHGMIPEWAEESTPHFDKVEGYSSTYRSYEGAWWSWRDHSKFLKYTPLYRRLFKLPPTNYKLWAQGLKKCGYATDKYYAEKLINLIEELKLHQYDKLVQQLET